MGEKYNEMVKARIEQLLKRVDRNKRQLASAAGIDQSYFSKILNGSRPWREEFKNQVHQAFLKFGLNITIDDVFGYSGPKENTAVSRDSPFSKVDHIQPSSIDAKIRSLASDNPTISHLLEKGVDILSQIINEVRAKADPSELDSRIEQILESKLRRMDPSKESDETLMTGGSGK